MSDCSEEKPLPEQKKFDEDEKHKELLEKIVQRQEKSRIQSMGTKRLKNELLKIWKSEGFKNKHFTVDLVEDSLYQWMVRLMLSGIDSGSDLHRDLVKLKAETGQEGVLLHFVFSERFPLDPPLVRVVEPVIKKGHVFEYGGVMCMELLMHEGWVPAYTIETVILQIAATLVRGGGRVNFSASKEEYSLEKAQIGFKQLEKLPDRHRYTSKFDDG